MNAFRKKKISIETLPEYLRETRYTLDLTVAHVCRLTQIPEKHLLSLETGDYESLPADVYVRGYLKSLGTVYQIPADALLEQFKKERGIDQSVKLAEKPTRSSEELSRPHLALTPRTITIFTVVMLALTSAGYLVWQLRSVSAAPNLKVVYPASDISISSRSILLRGETEIGSRVYINGQEVLVDELGDFREVINLAEGANNLHIASRNKFGNEASVNRVLVVSGVEKIAGLTSTSTEAENRRPITISIQVGPDPAWISVSADGKILHNNTMDAQTELVFSADKEIVLTTGNAGVTKVTYNGQDLGALGQPGEVISDIRFTP